MPENNMRLGDVILDVSDLATGKLAAASSQLSSACGRNRRHGRTGWGRSEILRVLFGIDPAIAGGISIDGQSGVFRRRVPPLMPVWRLVPENRKTEGLIIESSVAANIGLAGLSRFVEQIVW